VRQRLCWVLFLMTTLWCVTGWVFARTLHYRSQQRTLDPAHYTVELVSAEDHAKLADPAQTEVVLSDGSTVVKSEAYQRLVVPAFRPVPETGQFVRVSTLGTAHCLDRITTATLPATVLALAGLFLTWPRGAKPARRKKAE